MIGTMGKYNVKQKQNLDGIVTLTNDTLALENVRKSRMKER